jgi:hypothetical protein
MKEEIKYPEYILKAIRKRMGLEENDNSNDERINKMSKDNILNEYFSWHGIIGYGEEIKMVVEDIYKVDLNEYCEKMVLNNKNNGNIKSKQFEFNFEVTNDSRKGIPYAAKIKLNDKGNFEREFFDLDKTYGKKEVTVSGKYFAEVGDIIEEREAGSWKNDYRYFYVIKEDGQKEKICDNFDSNGKTRIKKYLKNEISIEELIRGE